MATGGKVPGRLPGSAGSEHLSQRMCQPCLEKDNLVYATGLCVDCQDYLCLKCSDDHEVHQHRVLDKEQMLHGQTQAKPEDACSDFCLVHKDEVIQYYCTSHCHLVCQSCINLDHATCDEVHYIPHVSNELVNNEDYRQVENRLKSVLDTIINVLRNALQKADEVKTSCEDALRELYDYKRKLDEALENVERELKADVQISRFKAEKELAEMRNKYKTTHEELQSSLAKKEVFQNTNQNCSSFIEMMRAKAKVKSLEDQTQQAEIDITYRQSPIRFSPNGELLELLRNPRGFGTVSSTGARNVLTGSDEVPVLPDIDTESVLSWSDEFSVISDTESMISRHALRTETLFHGSATGGILSGSAFGTQEYHLQELNVKTDDKCRITGMVVLPDNRLVLTDYRTACIKAVDLQTGHVVAQLELNSRPWDITYIEKNEIAVTIPFEKKIAFLTFGDDNLRLRTNLKVGGTGVGVDYRNGKLAVSFIHRDSHKIQILNLKGRVLHSIKGNKSKGAIFYYPCYLNFSQDGRTLYVSNESYNNVVCVKFDGTVLATYRDADLLGPRKIVVDRSGNVYVCALRSKTVHQMTNDCKKLQVVLTEADGLDQPASICLSEEEDKLYVAMLGSDYVKVYRTGPGDSP